MLIFVFGTLSSAVAFGVTYLCGLVQNLYYNKEKGKKKIVLFWIFNITAIVLVIVSYILFLIGSLNALFAFTNSLS